MKRLLSLSIIPFLCSVCIGQALPFQQTHDGSILELKFSPSNKRLVSYSSGNQDMVMWNVADGRVLWKRPIDTIQKADEHYTLNAIAWSPNEKLIATGSGNGTVQIWSAETGDLVWIAEVAKEDVTAVRFSPDGKSLAATSSFDQEIGATLFSTKDGEKLRTFRGRTCTGVVMAFDTDGRSLRLGNLDGNITSWNLETGEGTTAELKNCGAMRTYDWETSFSDDLSLSVVKIGDDTVNITDKLSNKVIATAKPNDSRIRSAISSRGRIAVISEYGGFRLFDLEKGTNKLLDDCVAGNTFDLSSDGKLFVQSCDGFQTSLRVTKLEDGSVSYLDGHPSGVHSIAYSPDYSQFAVAGNDGNAYVFEASSKRLLASLRSTAKRLTAIAYDKSGKHLIAGDDKGSVAMWDIENGKTVKTTVLEQSSEDIVAIESDKDGANFLVHYGGHVSVLNSDLNYIGSIITEDGYTSTSGDMTVGASSVPVSSAGFNFDGTKVITGHDDGSIRIWDVESMKQIKKIAAGKGVLVASLRTSNGVVAFSLNREKSDFCVYDLRSGTLLKRSTTLDGTYAERIAVSPDGRFATITDISGDVVICDLATMSVREINRDSGDDAVAFDKTGSTFIIGGDDQNLEIYDTSSLKRIWQLIADFVPSAVEIERGKARELRLREIARRKKVRTIEADKFAAKHRRNITISFSHFGDMSDPLQKRMVESDEIEESKARKKVEEANAVWLRLTNKTPLPINVPTRSMYMPNRNCFFQLSTGEKLFGLCENREIAIWFGVLDTKNKPVRYGFDFGSSVNLLPNSSVLFSIPIEIWKWNYSIVFDVAFQKEKASENDNNYNFGKEFEIKVNRTSLLAREKSRKRP